MRLFAYCIFTFSAIVAALAVVIFMLGRLFDLPHDDDTRHA